MKMEIANLTQSAPTQAIAATIALGYSNQTPELYWIAKLVNPE
tara:strand:- start:285 stop:413 length:129 start_codon:yes stop_codon:yes gene_type:complete